MLNRRQFLTHTLKGSSLVALNAMVPQFVSRTAQAATPGKDNILVVLEMTGGNDGLNTVIPYADDLYHKARPTLRQTKDVVIRLDDHVGLHSGMQGFADNVGARTVGGRAGRRLSEPGALAFRGHGYLAVGRSQRQRTRPAGSAGPRWKPTTTRVACRSCTSAQSRLPLALSGVPGSGAVTVSNQNSFRLELGGGNGRAAEGATPAPGRTGGAGRQGRGGRLALVRATAASANADRGRATPGVTRRAQRRATAGETTSPQKLQLIAGLIAKGFGTRIFYISLEGFDTHANQGPSHNSLLADLASAVSGFFQTLKTNGHDRRVRLMTFSEFGRRVQENSSRGTDHGAASCLFVAGPSVKGGVVGKHPSLADLDADDLKFHTDFRRVYATQLDSWLGCDSKSVLGARWDHLKELELRA